MGNADFANLQALDSFRSIRWLHNHWSRPIGPKAYYLYLTFEDRPELLSLAEKCQEAIAFPYYDLTPPGDLHLTLDRIAFTGDVTLDQLRAIENSATQACAGVPPFAVTIGSLGGTRSAIGFTAFPARPIRDLRDALRASTLSVYPDAPIRGSDFHPHVAIAYVNSDNVPAAEAISAVEKLNSAAHVSITITEASLVLLERRPRSYSWQMVKKIPLTGN